MNVNVGGKLYQIPQETLIKIPYFTNMIEDCQDTSTIFVNRSSMLFDHVLAYVIDPLHPYPKKYYYELDFYCIEYDITKLYTKDMEMMNTLKGCMDEVRYIISKRVICIQCNRMQLCYDGGLLCDKCKEIPKCIFSQCFEKPVIFKAGGISYYCQNHYKVGLFCSVRDCNRLKNGDKYICYMYHHDDCQI